MMNFLPINGSAEIIRTEATDHMVTTMDRLTALALFSPQTTKDSYVGKRRAE